jgi:hypothetical protein
MIGWSSRYHGLLRKVIWWGTTAFECHLTLNSIYRGYKTVNKACFECQRGKQNDVIIHLEQDEISHCFPGTENGLSFRVGERLIDLNKTNRNFTLGLDIWLLTNRRQSIISRVRHRSRSGNSLTVARWRPSLSSMTDLLWVSVARRERPWLRFEIPWPSYKSNWQNRHEFWNILKNLTSLYWIQGIPFRTHWKRKFRFA